MSDPCFECGQPAEHDHHVVPLSRGGTKTVPLCGICHAKAHHRDGNMANRRLTKEGMAVLKRNGVVFGKPENLTNDARLKGAHKSAQNRIAKAIDDMSDVALVVAQMKAGGATLQAMADHLNAEGYVTRQGGSWQPTQVLRVLRRSVAHA